MAVNPSVGTNTVVASGGVAVVAIPASPAGGFITNPADPVDQGFNPGDPPENLYISPISAPGSTQGDANSGTFVLGPGETWTVIAGQTTPTMVNAATSGHKFSAIYWPTIF